MSTPVSVPQAAPQPNTQIYSLLLLNLFSTYTRDSYLAKFGVQAPNEDPTRPAQNWFDSTVSGPTTYNFFNTVTGKSESFVVQNPNVPNIAGVQTYPVAPPPAGTDAYQESPTGNIPLNPALLSLSSDAVTLEKAFQVSDPAATLSLVSFAGFPYVYPADEPRRVWQINFKGVDINVASKLALQNAAGVGAPGDWDFSGTEPIWVSTVPTPVAELPSPQPLPQRSFLSNEVPQQTLMGWDVVRTDINPTPTPSPTTDGFNATDRANLIAVVKALGLTPAA